jgi:hypothetical protein
MNVNVKTLHKVLMINIDMQFKAYDNQVQTKRNNKNIHKPTHTYTHTHTHTHIHTRIQHARG